MPLSIALPTAAANQNAVQWKESIRDLEAKVQQHGREASELLETIADWDDIAQGRAPQGKSVAVLRSPDVFRVAWLNNGLRRDTRIGKNFYIRPLIPELAKNAHFYVLALSQKDVRLLKCNSSSAEEVPFAGDMALSFDAFMNTAKPDHNRLLRASAGVASGSSKGVFAGTGTEGEDRDKYLAQFYKQIDRGVNDAARGKLEPLVLAGVEYELSIYRSVNSYPRMMDESVQGAPNSLKSGEMHARALEAMGRCYERKVDEALAEYNHKAGGGASNRLKDIVSAAHEGRVLTLFVSDSLEQLGTYDASTHTVKGRESGNGADEDLLNNAVVQTIVHSGNVLTVPNNKMPNGAPLSAIFRF